MRGLFQGRNKLSMVFQSELAECGLACIAMISQFYGRALSMQELRKTLDCSSVGASVKSIVQLANTLDMMCRPLKLSLEELGDISTPAILHWDLDHFVVLKKVTRTSAIIHDPAVGIRTYGKNELNWHFTGIALELFPGRAYRQEKEKVGFSFSHLFTLHQSFYNTGIRIFILTFVYQICSLLAPLYLQLVIDQGLDRSDTDLVFFLAQLFLLVVFGKVAVGYLRSTYLLQFSSRVGYEMTSNVFSHLLYLPLGFFKRREIGDIASRFSSLESIKQLVTQEMITVVVDGLFSLLALLLLFMYSPFLASITLATCLLFISLRLVTIYLEKNYRQEVLLSGAKQQTVFLENIKSIAITKLYALERQQLSSWQESAINHINSSYKLAQLQLKISSIQMLLTSLENVATIYFGAILISSNQFSLGQLIGFIFVKQHFMSSVFAMLPKYGEIRLMKLELERVSDITLEDREPDSHSLLQQSLSGDIEASNLSFGHGSSDTLLIDDLNFAVSEAHCAAIVGDSGSGKSTLLNLFLGLESLRSGEIRIGGVEACRVARDRFRKDVSAVLHDDALLAGDIAYNIHLDADSFDSERLKQAAETASIYQTITALPMGFSTQVGMLGSALSAGQIQRIILARALFRNPRILVLDEALSHMGDKLGVELLNRLKVMGLTVLFVTHNPVLAEHADTVIHLS